MTVSFVANFMNHHQLPFSLNMQRLTNDNYTFIAFGWLPQEQRKLGYHELLDFPFILEAYKTQVNYDKAIEKILTDDMVIFGSCPDELIVKRAQTKKPFIIYSERFLKKGTYRRFVPMTYKKIWNRMLRFENDNVKIICSSAYLPYDLKLLRAKFETYKWGYFPEVKIYNDIKKILELKRPASILWVGRLIEWKRPKLAIKVAKKLKQQGYEFNLKFVGEGVLKTKLEKLISKYKLQDKVFILGSMSPEQVREQMEQAEIFLFTSNRKEGWGAVMNEAMNSGCAVVASSAIGSAPYLIKDKENGLMFKSSSCNDLFIKVKYLLDNIEKRKELGKNAYLTIINEWNAETASERLYNVMQSTVKNQTIPVYNSGPCSKAEVIKG